MAFDVSALTGYTDEKSDALFARALFESVTIPELQHMLGIKSSVKIPDQKLASSGILQDGSTCSSTQAGTIAIAQRELAVKTFKLAMKFCVTDLEPYFMQKTLPAGSTYDGLGNKEGQFMEHIINTISQVMEVNTWDGVAGGANADTSLNLVDGFTEIIKDEIAAAGIPAAQVLANAQTTGNIIASWRAMIDALPAALFNKVGATGLDQLVLFTDPVSVQTYWRDYQNANGALPYNTAFEKQMLDGTNVQFIGVPGLNGSGKSFLTQRKNVWFGTDVANEETDLTVSQGSGSELDYIFVSGRFKAGYQIQFPEEVVTNNFV